MGEGETMTDPFKTTFEQLSHEPPPGEEAITQIMHEVAHTIAEKTDGVACAILVLKRLRPEDENSRVKVLSVFSCQADLDQEMVLMMMADTIRRGTELAQERDEAEARDKRVDN